MRFNRRFLLCAGLGTLVALRRRTNPFNVES